MPYTLITGASSGIGLEFAHQLAKKKQSLILVARSEDKLQSTANELRDKYQVKVEIIALDLANNDSAEKLYEECKTRQLDVNFLINDAGVGLIGKFDNFAISDIERMLTLNVLTLTKLCYLFLPDLRRSKGTIINLASQVAFAPSPYMTAYAATKAYVLNFSLGLRVEEKEGVKILALCPGPTHTKFFEKTEASSDDINFKFRPAKDVVDQALSALKSNKAVTLVGWENKVMTFLLRFIPKTMAAKFSSTIVKDGENKPDRPVDLSKK